MAIPSLVRAAFVLGVVVVAAATAASVELAITTDHYILKGKVLCLDCHASYDLSGIHTTSLFPPPFVFRYRLFINANPKQVVGFVITKLTYFHKVHFDEKKLLLLFSLD